MDLIREWITSLAGVIAIAAICDTIMIDGEMKKYLKPILGFVIIITVSKPIIGIGSEITFDIPEGSAVASTDFSAKVDELEQKNVSMLYQQKLAERVKSELKNFSQDYINTTVFVTVNNSGEMKNITINLNKSTAIDTLEKIKETISKKFAVDVSNISVISGKG